LSLWAFFAELPVGWLFVYLLTQENHLAWALFLPRAIWGLYAIFANVEYYRLNKAFWDKQK
jgi:tryptophan-rich sensory protein